MATPAATVTLDQASAMPADEALWSVAGALATHAANRPDAPCFAWCDGPAASYAQMLDRATRVANGLAERGVARGETVALMLPNSPAFVEMWLGLAVRGAVEVPVNLHFKHRSLTHVLQDSQAKVIVVAADQLAKLVDVAEDLDHLEQVIVVETDELGQDGSADVLGTIEERWTIHAFADVRTAELPVEPFALPDHRDLAAVLYTSGTTGAAKGIMLTHAHITVSAWAHIRATELTASDRFFVCMPLFHSNAQVVQTVPTLLVGAMFCLWPEFSASGWLDQVRRSGATVTNTLGVMTEFVYAQPARADDGDNSLRVVQAIPAPGGIAADFERRFAVRLVGAYGLTDCAMLSYRQPGAPLVPGGSGTVVAGFEVVVADPETDLPVPVGTVGEILARPRVPFAFMAGYWRRPEATVAAWRNLWMHTGDAGWFDENGELFFHDRLKDSIRVRGENVSSAELEAEVLAHPQVRECAAVAIPHEHGDDDIKIVVVAASPGALTAEELLDHCQERVPYFAVPRYVEFLDELPRTPTEKVRKVELRERGVTASTWDRTREGYRVRR